MGLGLLMRGAVRGGIREPSQWLIQVANTIAESFIHDIGCDVERDVPFEAVVGLNLHPAAPMVELMARGDGQVAVEAQTSTMGPGYHAQLCDALRLAAERHGIAWQAGESEDEPGDETGYYQHRDRQGLEREFLAWLRGLAGAIQKAGGNPVSVNLPPEHRYRHDGVVATPMGPRGTEWVSAVAADPARGIDLFPWWSAGQGPEYLLGRAVARMWTEIRWRAPIDDGERETLREVADLLLGAYQQQPQQRYPWREWHEVVGHLGDQDPLGGKLEAQARASKEPPIGYRRRPVDVAVNGFSITIPGELSEGYTEEGTWIAEDQARTIHLTIMDAPGASAAEALEGAEVPRRDRQEMSEPGRLGRAAFSRERDESGEYECLHGAIAAPGRLAIITVAFPDPSLRPWALTIWRSLKPER